MSDIRKIVYQRFKPIFQAYDKDGSSTLEKPQLRVLLADSLGVQQGQITNQQLDWHFNRVDQNKDGKITYAQYFSAFFGDRALTAKNKLKQKTQNNTQNINTGVGNAVNENQVIDIDEFRILLQDTFKNLKITVTEEMVRWNFDQIDTDHSGRIQFKQYLAFIKKYN